MTIVMISGYIQFAQNKNAKSAKFILPDSKSDVISNEASVAKPKILFILKNDDGQASWSPSLWWSYQHKEQEGC